MQVTTSVNNDIISIKVPVCLKRHRGKKLMVQPDGVQAVPVKRPPDQTILRALVKAYFWKSQIDSGKYESVAEMCKRKKLDSSYVSRVLKLNLLAPRIKQAILDGTQPRELELRRLMGAFPMGWREQCGWFGVGD